MRQRALSLGFCIWLVTWMGFIPARATAQRAPSQRASTQQSTTISISSGAESVADLLRRGRLLEVERRWSEALTHYEDALRLYPEEDSLQRRFSHTRLHYGVGRRYADRSYQSLLSKLGFGEALDLYVQVLLKIQAHYVGAPSWKELVEHGTNNFEVALAEPEFLQRNLPQEARSTVDAFRHELRRLLGSRVIGSHSDARDAVSTAAGLAQQRLGVPPTAVVLEYLCGATHALDQYSAYLTPDQLAEVYAQIEGNFVGLGIELKAVEDGLLIVRAIRGSPAEQEGILAGDHVLAVDGHSTKDLSTDQAANLLQGEAGSVVELTVAGADRQPRHVSVRRRRVEVPSVDDVKIVDRVHGIAYLRLACFQKTTCRDLDDALWKLHRQGMKSLIIDLRGNPGGLLVAAVEVVDKFVQHGIIVSTRGRGVQEDFTYVAHSAGTWRVPLVVLIDEDSASAAEIFAGAIRDHGRGTIVGQRSYGKGSVQGIFPLSIGNTGVRLTTAKFYSPAGRPYCHVGVQPDVSVHLAARPADEAATEFLTPGDDGMLAAAVQAAQRPRQPR
ncbi:MAG: hypothetical protein A2V70_05360 [Planctomycetes bacterium RBG_13_63_9]|nr:MAG: hypothetical protein A2V70_05360 [Planctomycetes bacterium RBG_13_63_9]